MVRLSLILTSGGEEACRLQLARLGAPTVSDVPKLPLSAERALGELAASLGEASEIRTEGWRLRVGSLPAAGGAPGELMFVIWAAPVAIGGSEDAAQQSESFSARRAAGGIDHLFDLEEEPIGGPWDGPLY